MVTKGLPPEESDGPRSGSAGTHVVRTVSRRRPVGRPTFGLRAYPRLSGSLITPLQKPAVRVIVGARSPLEPSVEISRTYGYRRGFEGIEETTFLQPFFFFWGYVCFAISGKKVLKSFWIGYKKKKNAFQTIQMTLSCRLAGGVWTYCRNVVSVHRRPNKNHSPLVLVNSYLQTKKAYNINS